MSTGSFLIRPIAAFSKVRPDELGLREESIVMTIEKHGNTSAASVPLAFDVAVRDGQIKRGDLVLMEAMGGGFTWGATLVRY